METLEDLAEMTPAGHDLAQDQWRPSLGEYLRSTRNRAELAVSRHGQIVGLPGGSGNYEFRSSNSAFRTGHAP